MDHELKLEQVDVDGDIRETAAEALDGLDDGDTRAGFLKKAGLAGGAVMGGGALLTALTPGAAMAAGKGAPPAKFGKGDVGVLNFALTLEYLEAAFYNEASSNQKKGFIKDGQTQVFLKTVTADENAHVAYLKKALGSKAIAAPKVDFGGTTSDEKKFVETALALENTGVHAYLGQALNIKTPSTVAAALSIATIEARHASVIGLIAKNSSKGIVPDGSFDKPFTAAKVLKAVEATGFLK
jgi:rubrerythrin